MTVSLRGHDNSNYGQQSSKKYVCKREKELRQEVTSKCDMLRKTVQDPYSGDWKSSVAVA